MRPAHIVLGVALLLAIAGPHLAPYNPLLIATSRAQQGLAPSTAHWLGTDPLGRDIASRLLAGSRYSLGIATGALLLATLMGSAVGGAAALAGGHVARVVMRAIDVCVAVPRVVLLLAVVGVWGGATAAMLVLLLGMTGWFDLARLVRRSLSAQLVEERVAAARALGVTRGRLFWSHLLPETAGVIRVWASGEFGQLLLLEAGLSFLGLGVPAPLPSWGRVLLETGDVFGPARLLVVGPGLLIALVVGASQSLTDELADGWQTPLPRG